MTDKKRHIVTSTDTTPHLHIGKITISNQKNNLYFFINQLIRRILLINLIVGTLPALLTLQN